MSCAEFEEFVQRSLDGIAGGGDPGLMEAHARSCARCTELKRSLTVLDGDLRNLPQPEIPASVMTALEQIPASRPALGIRLSWKPELVRASLLAGGVILLALLFDQLQTEGRALAQLLLGTAGFFFFALAVLHPLFLPAASEAASPR